MVRSTPDPFSTDETYHFYYYYCIIIFLLYIPVTKSTDSLDRPAFGAASIR